MPRDTPRHFIPLAELGTDHTLQGSIAMFANPTAEGMVFEFTDPAGTVTSVQMEAGMQDILVDLMNEAEKDDGHIPL